MKAHRAHPALFEGAGKGRGGGRGAKKLWNTFQRLRPEEFSSRDFGMRSFRRPEISAWADISGRKLRIFQRQCWALVRWKGGGGGGGGGEEDKGQNLNEIIKKIKFDNSGPLLATAQNYLLHSSLPLYSLMLTNGEGSHFVRLYIAEL